MSREVKTIIRSNYSGLPIEEKDAKEVKVTVKIGSEAVQNFTLDFHPDEYAQFIEALESSKPAPEGKPQPKLVPIIPARGSSASTSGGGATESQKIRAWAKDNGHEVNAKGAIPQEVKDKYYVANPA